MCEKLVFVLNTKGLIIWKFSIQVEISTREKPWGDFISHDKGKHCKNKIMIILKNFITANRAEISPWFELTKLNCSCTFIFIEKFFVRSCSTWKFLSTSVWYIKFWPKIDFHRPIINTSSVTWQQHFIKKTLPPKMFKYPFSSSFWEKKTLIGHFLRMLEIAATCETL